MDFRPELSWEFLSGDEITAKSVRAVRNHVRHVKEASPYYREALFDVFPEDIKSIDDIVKLPFTERTTLVEKTQSFIAVPPDRIAETVVTSGTTGSPLAFSLTAADIDRLTFNDALAFYSGGITNADRAQVCVSLDNMFIGGMSYYRGMMHVGANTSRIGVMPSDIHRHYFDLLHPTVIVGVPSFLIKLSTEFSKPGSDNYMSSIKKIFCTGESIRKQDMQLNGTGKTLEDFFGAKAYSTYGNTELSISYCECIAQNGGHCRPELVYTEIVDGNGAPVPDGTPGEIVATPLGVEGMPLVRYKTGDIAFRVAGSCACGRNSMRIGPILGRKSQLIKVKGTTVYPLAITGILDDISEIDDYIIMLENDESLSDRVSLHAVTAPANVEKISSRLRTELRVHVPVLISNMATILHYRGKSGKKARIIDKRKHGVSAVRQSTV